MCSDKSESKSRHGMGQWQQGPFSATQRECQMPPTQPTPLSSVVLLIPWTARRSNQSILKEISAEYSLEGLMLKPQYFGHLMQRSDSLEKTLNLGKIEDWRRRGQQRMRWLDGNTNSVDMSLSKLGSLVCCSPWGHKDSDTTE